MNHELTQYTFTFDNSDEKKFRNIMSRLDEDEFEVIEEIHKIPPKNEHYAQSEMQTTMKMEPAAASTFRFGMSTLKIERLRTAEELAEKKAIEDQHIVRVNIKVAP
jgi:hypothetical protein